MKFSLKLQYKGLFNMKWYSSIFEVHEGYKCISNSVVSTSYNSKARIW